jgi:hypothetical protein
MIVGHLVDWWTKTEYYWIFSMLTKIFEPIGAAGFIFISGISITLSYRTRLGRIKTQKDYNYRMLRNSYFLRAIFIFMIAIIYNLTVVLRLNDFSMIWTWFVLLTISISLFLVWPLLKTKKIFRIGIAITIIILQQFLISWLSRFEGNSNIMGVIFHILYNGKTQDPILVFFPFFLIGTVLGDVIFDTIYLNDKNDNGSNFIRKFLLPCCITGTFLIIFGVLLQFPQFLLRQRLSWIIYSLGFEIILFSILVSIDKYNYFNTKRSFRFIFYFSYYSLTIYLGHNLLYFVFLNQLNLINLWIFILVAYICLGLILRTLYKLLKEKASLKAQVAKLSLKLTHKIEKRKLKT